jgi:sarcosine oxidase, subunit beta
MVDTAEVVVVGAGVTGLATAWALTQRGMRDVLVLDRGAVGTGGTGKSSGVVRCHYGVASLAAMAWSGLEVLESAPEILGGDSGFRRTGYLVGVGPENLDALENNVAMHQAIGISVELVTASDAQQLWPAADLDSFAGFAFEPRGGYGDGHQTAQAFAAAARRGGARIRQGTPVGALTMCGDRVGGVELADGDRISGGEVVMAAGAWSAALVRGIGIDLPIRSQRAQILMVDPGVALGEVPVFSDLVSLQYIRPDVNASLLVGDSDHSAPEWADPDDYDNRADEGHLAKAIPKFIRRFPGLPEPMLTSSYAGCYDVTPDYNPVMSASGVDGLWLCAGFSGHGYKISPAVGNLMADLVCYGESKIRAVDHRDFGLGRFARHELLESAHPYIGAGQMR